MGGGFSGPALIADSMISLAAILGLWVVLGFCAAPARSMRRPAASGWG
ncbi:hypothetical protein QWZ10_24195 [Paracoccus cavernae]|uniref:Uncharacterized protein n=1 Tax=Paracoccus cavernae TaxID=1571207 RepID=A0ABT8DBD7_9RHOB|nr:hypothetical protein [Paracoccus cavernae]